MIEVAASPPAKGIGGFHLCCDVATSSGPAPQTLKARPMKPFAVMMRDPKWPGECRLVARDGAALPPAKADNTDSRRHDSAESGAELDFNIYRKKLSTNSQIRH